MKQTKKEHTMKKTLIIAFFASLITAHSTHSMDFLPHSMSLGQAAETLGSATLSAGMRLASGFGAAAVTTYVIPALVLPTGYALNAVEQVWKNPGVAKAVRNEVTIRGVLTAIPFVIANFADYKLLKYTLLGR